MKKKPLVTVRNAHGSKLDSDKAEAGIQSGSQGAAREVKSRSQEAVDIKSRSQEVGEENWISAVAALHNSDLVASGTITSLFTFIF